MIKSELVKRIAAKRPPLRESDVEKGVNGILQEIASALSRGDRVELRGFGVFSIHRHRPRPARNPRTGAVIQLGPRYLPAFKIGRQLHNRLNAAVVVIAPAAGPNMDVEHRDALAVLATSRAGMTELLLVARGVSLEALDDLVRAGFAKVGETQRQVGGRVIVVRRFHLTDTGRQRLHPTGKLPHDP